MPSVQQDGTVDPTDDRGVRAIRRLSPGMDVATVRGVITRIGRRPTRRRHVLTEGVLADRSGHVRFASRAGFVADRGDRLHVTRANVEEWRDAPELHLDEADRIVVTPGPDGVPRAPAPIPLSEVTIGDRAVTVRGRIRDVDTVGVRMDGALQRVRRGRIGDGSAIVYVTDWTARPGLTPGRALRLENVYVRPYRDVPSINLSRFSSIAPADEAVPSSRPPIRRTVAGALETAGLADVRLVGTIVALRDGSGLVRRCPRCRRVVGAGRCRRHGNVSPVPDLRTKAVLDDGTGTVTVILDASITASIYGAGLEVAREEAHTTMHQDVVADRIARTIVGRPYVVRGRLGIDAQGGTLVARSFARRDSTPTHRAARALGGNA